MNRKVDEKKIIQEGKEDKESQSNSTRHDGNEGERWK
jgi:hypothetical protein